MHTLDARESHGEYVLVSDIREQGLSDTQVARAIIAARAGQGERVEIVGGAIEVYVRIDGCLIAVLRCE